MLLSKIANPQILGAGEDLAKDIGHIGRVRRVRCFLNQDSIGLVGLKVDWFLRAQNLTIENHRQRTHHGCPFNRPALHIVRDRLLSDARSRHPPHAQVQRPHRRVAKHLEGEAQRRLLRVDRVREAREGGVRQLGE